MIRLSSIIKQFKDRFLDRYQTAILPCHQKALYAMQQCRKASNHHMLARCTGCHKKVFIPHSCGHRSCPHCQNHEGWQWIENQLSKQLPAQYYLITFTLPYQLRRLAWHNQKIVYALMFLCVQQLLKTFTLNDKQSCRVWPDLRRCCTPIVESWIITPTSMWSCQRQASITNMGYGG